MEVVLDEELGTGFAGLIEHGSGEVDVIEEAVAGAFFGDELIGALGEGPEFSAGGAGFDREEVESGVGGVCVEFGDDLLELFEDAFRGDALGEVVVSFVEDDGAGAVLEGKGSEVVEGIVHVAAAETARDDFDGGEVGGDVFVPETDGGTAEGDDGSFGGRIFQIGGFEFFDFGFEAGGVGVSVGRERVGGLNGEGEDEEPEREESFHGGGLNRVGGESGWRPRVECK